MAGRSAPMPDRIDQIVDRVIAESSAVSAKFEDVSNYNGVLGYTLKRTVRDVAGILDAGRVLEVGFFTGVVSASLSDLGYEVIGTDIPFVANDGAMKAFLDKHRVASVPWDLKDEAPGTLRDDYFDLIVFTEVIEHLPFNAIPLLSRLRSLLRPGGTLYCATPNQAYFKNRLKLLRGQDIGFPVSHLIAGLTPETGASVGLHWHEYTRQTLADLFVASGFEMVAHRFVKMNSESKNFAVSLVKSMLFKIAPSMMEGQVACFRRPD
jgi:2-polyprenyl-6-hydroxyphenyl methylase/3-demethylubiquinone-9 3-methyltransferase